MNNLFEEGIATEILAIPISITPSPDKLVWTANRLGTYTVKSGYNRIHNKDETPTNTPSSSYQIPKALWHEIWKIQTFPKIRFFLWNLCTNTLPTKKNLYKRQMLHDPTCQICRHALESTEHLFTLCAWTKNIWLDPHLHADTSPERITCIDKWIFENLTSRADQHSKALFAGALWQI